MSLKRFSEFERSERRLNTMFNVIAGFIFLVFVGIIAFWAFVIYQGVKIASDPEAAGHFVGETVKKIQKGVEEGYNEKGR